MPKTNRVKANPKSAGKSGGVVNSRKRRKEIAGLHPQVVEALNVSERLGDDQTALVEGLVFMAPSLGPPTPKPLRRPGVGLLDRYCDDEPWIGLEGSRFQEVKDLADKLEKLNVYFNCGAEDHRHHPIRLLPLRYALVVLRLAALELKQDKAKGIRNVRWTISHGLVFLARSAGHIGSSHARSTEETIARIHCYQAIELLELFANIPGSSLARLFRCQGPRCPAPWGRRTSIRQQKLCAGCRSRR